MRLIETTAETTRELRQFIRSADAGASIQSSGVSTITKPVIAKIGSAISAGDYTPKLARLLTISGGALVSTGQTVLVRHVGTGSIAADSVVLTEPCGKLGHCFARNSSPATPVSISVERYIRFLSQLSPETGLENKAWIQYSGIGTSTGVLQAYWDPLGTPTTIDANGNRIFDYKMRGIRFAIDGHNDLFNWTTALQSQFASANTPFTGRAALLPSASSHVLLNLSQIQIPNGGFSRVSSTVSVSTTHYRVWIDGTDVTGIVALGSPFLHDGIRINSEVPNRFIGGLMSVSGPSGSYQSKSVWFDLWVTVRVINRASDYTGDPTLFSSYYPAAQVTYYAQHMAARFNSANVNANVYAGDQYRISFADNGPGGLSSLDVATAVGWTLTTSNAGFKLIKAGTGAIELNWATEAPVLTCSIDAKINSPSGASGNMRYLPSGSDYHHRNQNNTVVQYGTWNPQGTTVFNQIARAFGSTYFTKGSANALASFFTGFPSTITVEKI